MGNTPEHFLELVRRQRRGEFKIHIGMSGKTYRMLQEAHTPLACPQILTKYLQLPAEFCPLKALFKAL